MRRFCDISGPDETNLSVAPAKLADRLSRNAKARQGNCIHLQVEELAPHAALGGFGAAANRPGVVSVWDNRPSAVRIDAQSPAAPGPFRRPPPAGMLRPRSARACNWTGPG